MTDTVVMEAPVVVTATVTDEVNGVPTPAFDVHYDGKPITAELAPYVVSLAVTDTLIGEADTLEITVDNLDDRWLDAWYPDIGATLTVAIGYRGEDLVPQGSFTFDELHLQASPAHVAIRAASASVDEAIRTRANRTYRHTTLNAIVQQVAGRHGWTLVGAIEAVPIDHLTQFGEPDLAFLRRLALTYGYILKVNAGGKTLAFSQLASLFETEPQRTFARSDLRDFSFTDTFGRLPKRVTHQRHDRRTGAMVAYGVDAQGKAVSEALTGAAAASGNALRMHRHAGGAAHAKVLTEAQRQRLRMERSQATITVWGDAALAAGQIITLTGLGKLGGDYIAIEVRHRLAGEGFTTELELRRKVPRPNGGEGGNGTLKVYGVKDGQTTVVGTTTQNPAQRGKRV